ncbi:MAG: DNA-protecting protein DprA [Candidatus Liptonbacteria bacterium]|nr:DNA-protecting protein DprA [Candidatus Liptonbacteria bacterium]
MQSNATAIELEDNSYPPLLREITNPPEQIFVRGELPNYNLPFIAIVGTRKATEGGRLLAKKIAKELAEKGFVIVSGLAMGMDTAAHEGALKGGGRTVAVLGTGIDKIYPAQNENLAGRILLAGGAIISEYETNAPGFKWQFLERNRIVAGLCVATVVIEAPERSGALVTARLAAEFGREVFIFSGPAGHPNYKGSHALIRDGARLVSSTQDILEDLMDGCSGAELAESPAFVSKKSVSEAERAWFLAKPKERGQEPSGRANGWESKTPSFRETKAGFVLDALADSKTPLSIDKILEITKLTPQEVNQILTDLTICGIVEETSLGYRLKN